MVGNVSDVANSIAYLMQNTCIRVVRGLNGNQKDTCVHKSYCVLEI